MIILNKGQREAVDIIVERVKNQERVSTLAGYAGTGKSTVVNTIIEEIGIPSEKVLFVTFTGKASLVLNQKGVEAQTIHSAFYDTKKIGENFIFTPKEELETDYRLIVIDEVSMVPNNLLKTIASHHIPVIALGDQGQLPPIGEDNGLLHHPHATLTEIMRQEEGNEILDFAMKARMGEQLPLFDGKDVKIIRKQDLVTGMFTWADQILCGKNTTRQWINKLVREQYGRHGLPVVGDKLICLRNYWDIESNNFPLINGTVGELSSVFYGQDMGILGQELRCKVKTDYAPAGYAVKIDGNPFKGFAPITEKSTSKMKQPLTSWDYGYAITVHKSQGSEYGKVLLFEEVLNRAQHDKWLYTAITRAADKLVIVK